MDISPNVTEAELIETIKGSYNKFKVNKGNIDFSTENNMLFDLDGKFFFINNSCVLLTYAGGDWELPVHYFVYKNKEGKLSSYVPTKGNTFNKDTNQAFGNDGVADYKYMIPLLKEHGHVCWEDLQAELDSLTDEYDDTDGLQPDDVDFLEDQQAMLLDFIAFLEK